MAPDCTHKILELDPETVSYFKRLPGYDTLRMVLASKLVLVEGPSDEIVFERIFQDVYKKKPMEHGIDVLSMRGLSLNRCLELCAALDKKVAAVRDNDCIHPDQLRISVQEWLADGQRELFIGMVEEGPTLEPQLVHFNGELAMRKILGIDSRADLLTWMAREKTECALRIAESGEKITPPNYLLAAAEFIRG